MKPIDPDKVTEDAYNRLQKLLDSRVEQKPTVIVPELAKEERTELRKTMAEKLVNHGNMPEYNANLLSEHLLELVEDKIRFAAKQQKTKTEQGDSGQEKFTGAFRRSED